MNNSAGWLITKGGRLATPDKGNHATKDLIKINSPRIMGE